ncbi:MAG TPA: hypothetical protein VN634_11150 [Candidatus Limnocylindrales bacterium]|nr:hypothetical protein [Candidatus Limnocylindrales bacterium]
MLVVLAVCLAPDLALLPTASADQSKMTIAIEEARTALVRGDWQAAKQALDGIAPGSEDDEKLKSQLLFYSALMEQKRSEDGSLDEATRSAARLAAIRSYETFLAANPTSGGVLNNLAQLYQTDPSSRAKAKELLDRAVKLRDGRTDVYEINRAKLLADQGRPSEALQVSRAIALKDQSNEAAHVVTVDLLRNQTGTGELVQYVRDLNNAGFVQRAQETALAEIESRRSGREPVLVALVESLANPVVGDSAADFAKGSIAQRLEKQKEEADIGAGVRELLGLYAKPQDPKSFLWWRRDFDEHEVSRPGTRAAALLDLSRALGDRCNAAGSDMYDCAEAYYRFAIDFTGATADPRAFLSLATILANTGRSDELRRISEQYEKALFNGKATAYDRRYIPEIYQFHVALGVMYGYLGKWSDPQFPPAGAVWQLKHAEEKASEYNRTAPASQKLELPPQAISLLSEGYLKTGAADDSVKIRVEAAEKYIAKGDKNRAREVLDAGWRTSLPAQTSPAMMNRVHKAATAAGAP